MARVYTNHHLEELMREAQVLSPIKAKVPNAWSILQDEINRAKASVDQQSRHQSSDDTSANPSATTSTYSTSTPSELVSSTPEQPCSISSTISTSSSTATQNANTNTTTNTNANSDPKDNTNHKNSKPNEDASVQDGRSPPISASTGILPSTSSAMPSSNISSTKSNESTPTILSVNNTSSNPTSNENDKNVNNSNAVSHTSALKNRPVLPPLSIPSASSASIPLPSPTATALPVPTGNSNPTNNNNNNNNNSTNSTNSNTSNNNNNNNNTQANDPSTSVATAAAVAAVNAFADASHPPLPTAVGPRHPIRKRVKLRVPAEQYPDYNFVGRLLGPRGATLKRLERDTACRIMIRGKGSIRKDKEAEVRGKPGYEHVFHEPLHVVIEVADATDDAAATRILQRAKELVEMLLIPVPEERDSLKRAQLRDLAILNGTHRSVTDLLGAPPPPPSAPPPSLSLPPSSSLPLQSPTSSQPPTLHSTTPNTPQQSQHQLISGPNSQQQGPQVALQHPQPQAQRSSVAASLHQHLTSLGGGGIGPARSPPPGPASSPPPLRRAHSTISTPSGSMFNPADAFSSPFEEHQGLFGRLTLGSSANSTSNHSSSNTNPNRSSSAIGGTFSGAASGFNSNPSASADSFLPDLSKLHIPTLDLDTHSDAPQALSSPLPLPASSPTLVDPDFYPYPPTPGVLSVDHNNSLSAFASPMWSRPSGSNTGTSGAPPGIPVPSGGLPPRSPPPPPGMTLPPRSPPASLSNGGGGPGTSGFLTDMGGNGNVVGSSVNGSASFIMPRQFSADSANRSSRDLPALHNHSRDASFDAAFANPSLSSGNLGIDDELASFTSQLSSRPNHQVGNGNSMNSSCNNGSNTRIMGVVGSPPSSFPVPPTLPMGSSSNTSATQLARSRSLMGGVSGGGMQAHQGNQQVGHHHLGGGFLGSGSTPSSNLSQSSHVQSGHHSHLSLELGDEQKSGAQLKGASVSDRQDPFRSSDSILLSNLFCSPSVPSAATSESNPISKTSTSTNINNHNNNSSNSNNNNNTNSIGGRTDFGDDRMVMENKVAKNSESDVGKKASTSVSGNGSGQLIEVDNGNTATEASAASTNTGNKSARSNTAGTVLGVGGAGVGAAGWK